MYFLFYMMGNETPQKIYLFTAFLLSHWLWTKHSPWREGFYYLLWEVRQNRRASLENSCQTTGLDIVALNSKSKLSKSHHDTDAESHHIWRLFPAPKSCNSACWSKQSTIPSYHKPQYKVKRTAALNLQNKVGI